ncbi:hypothetical protein SVIOM74S_02916 [Streptomyces violarus]
MRLIVGAGRRARQRVKGRAPGQVCRCHKPGRLSRSANRIPAWTLKETPNTPQTSDCRSALFRSTARAGFAPAQASRTSSPAVTGTTCWAGGASAFTGVPKSDSVSVVTAFKPPK